MVKQRPLYKIALSVLLLTQLVSALPFDTGPLLSGLWFVWIFICIWYALHIIVEKKAFKKNAFAIFLLVFFVINAISYYISPRIVQSFFVEVDTLVIFKSITIAILSYFPFYYYTKHGYIDTSNIRGFVILLFFTSILNLLHGNFVQTQESMEEHNVLNQAYLLVQLIPLFFIYCRGKQLFLLVAISGLLILWGSKRGAILCLLVDFLVFFIYIMKEASWTKRYRGLVLILIFAFVSISAYYVLGNDFLQERLLATGSDEDKSGGVRSGRYLMLYSVFFHLSDIKEVIFGHGFAQTVTYGEGLAHQDWVELLIDNGLVGFILYIILIYLCLKDLYKCKNLPKSVKYALICSVLNWCLIATYSMVYTSRDSFIHFFTLGIINGLIQRCKMNGNLKSNQKVLVP